MTNSTPAVDVPAHVLDFLRDHTTMTLATATPGGAPRATSLRYVNDGLTLYVWTRSQSWTAQQIAQNPLVSFTVTDEASGLQGSGEARLVLSGDEVETAVGLFAEKFPTALGASTMNISIFRIAPTSVKLVDETYGGGRGETQMFAGAEYKVEEVYNVVRDLPLGTVGVIEGRLQRVEVDAGAVIARQGAPADKFVIVLDGEVEVVRESDGASAQVATLGPGDFFGEVSIVLERPRTATLRASTAATLLTMEREDFRGVVAQALGATADFDRIIRERLGEVDGS
jgi:uncharacterized protein YhbP (UPF0306 family)